MAGAITVPVEVRTQGSVPPGATDSARGRVTSVLRFATEEVLSVRVKLIMSGDPAVERPAITQINVDLNGRLIRSHADGQDMREAIERACDRLRIRLERAARNWAALRGGQPTGEPGEWRHQSFPGSRPSYFPRQRQDRAVMRHKSYALHHETPDEAVADAELLDYDFHLFTEKSSGEDAVIYRSDHGHRLALAHNKIRRLGPMDTSITVSETPVERLPVTAAADRMEAMGWPFLFFVNDQTGRGNILYHRYDGHYGLIEPAAEAGAKPGR